MHSAGWGHGPGGGGGPGGIMRTGLASALDSNLDEELGKAYDHAVVTRLIGYLGPYKKRMLLALLCTLVYSITNSAGPRLIGLSIDHFISRGDPSGLDGIVAVFVANSLLAVFGQYGQSTTLSYVGQAVLHTLRTQMFDHIQQLSLGFFDRNEVGKLMSRVQNDVLALQELLTSGFLNVFQDIISLVLVVYFLFSMNLRLSLITLSVVPFLIVFLWLWQHMTRNAFMRVRHAISVVNAGLQENISGVRVIQSLSREKKNSEIFDNVNEAHLNANLRAGRLSAAVQPAFELMVAVATALVVTYGGYQALTGNLAVGELVAFTLYIQRFFEPIRELTMQYTQFQRAMVGGVRIFEVLDTAIEVADKPNAVELPPIKGNVKFEHVSFNYVDGIDVLKDISIDVRAGDTVAFVGQTGAGKSTMISLINRFYDVDQGAITIDGYDVRDVTQKSLRSQTGMVLQDPFLFTGAVRDNIRYGRLDATDEEVVEAAKTVGAHEFIVRLDLGYDTLLQERGGNLSVGQRQLISFARAVLADPKILILDEATANVDTQAEVLIQQALKRMLEGRTSFIIAHRLSTIRDADRIIVLEYGKIVEQGTHQELLDAGGIYSKLYTSSYAVVGALENGHSPNGTPPTGANASSSHLTRGNGAQ
ncbi:MAG: ABC transporter ATP-binding protein [Dehalococcoidia bacterium]|nr:ABC transporter ATP-binding protein [Dehalococcoidia bacterium]